MLACFSPRAIALVLSRKACKMVQMGRACPPNRATFTAFAFFLLRHGLKDYALRRGHARLLVPALSEVGEHVEGYRPLQPSVHVVPRLPGACKQGLRTYGSAHSGFLGPMKRLTEP